MNGIYEFKDGMWKVDENIDRIKHFHSHLEKIENAINETLKRPTEKIFDYDWSIFKNYEPTISYKSTTDLIKPLPQDFSLFEIIFGDVDFQSILSTYSKMIIIIVLLYIVVKLCKYKNKEISEINNLFKNVGFRNSKDKYAYVKYVKKYESYNLYRIIIPKGCSVIGLYKLLPAFENLFSNDVDVYEVDNEYFLKVFTKKLKKVENYPFQVVDIKDKSTLTLVVGHSLDGIFKLNLSDSLPHVLIGASTRAGKSRLIKSICLNVMENYTSEQVQMIYCDQKGGVEARAFRDCEHFIKISKNVGDTVKVFISLERELDRRLDLFEEKDVTNLVDYNKKYEKLPFIFVIVDELYPFLMSKNKKEIYNILADLLSRSASVGIHFLLSSQKTTGEVIPTFITENAGYRIGLRTSNEQGSYNVIGDKGCEDIPVDAKGRGICFVDEKIQFQSFYVDDDTINKICKKHKRQVEIEEEKFEGVINNEEINR